MNQKDITSKFSGYGRWGEAAEGVIGSSGSLRSALDRASYEEINNTGNLVESMLDEVFPREEDADARSLAYAFLTVPMNKKISLIKEVRTITGMVLRDCKGLVDLMEGFDVPTAVEAHPFSKATQALRDEIRQKESELSSLRFVIDRMKSETEEVHAYQSRTVRKLKSDLAFTEQQLKISKFYERSSGEREETWCEAADKFESLLKLITPALEEQEMDQVVRIIKTEIEMINETTDHKLGVIRQASYEEINKLYSEADNY